MSQEPEQIAASSETIYDSFGKARVRSSVFDPSTSPLFERVGFIVGAPRSGTTWLQQLLFAHPMIATGGESHLFCEVLPAAFENLRLPDQTVNLGTWVNEPELTSIARAFCDSVFVAMRDGTRPDAKVVLEKTPNHRLQAAFQAQLYPDARYVHIIRDGRDATASQRMNWSSLTNEFSHAGANAEAWADQVRDIRQHFGGLAYLELRYEDVVTDAPKALAAIFDHLGLPNDDTLCAAAAEFGKAPVNTYLGSFKVGVRKHEGDALAERSVARAAGDLLTELGYADAAEVERLRQLRTFSTVASDARDAVITGTRRGRRWAGKTIKRLRIRARRNQNAPAKLIGDGFIQAIEADDAAGLTKLLATRVRVNGSPAADAKSAAAELIAQVGGSRSARRSVFGGEAQLTFVSPEGKRVVVRVKPDNGVAAEVDVL